MITRCVAGVYDISATDDLLLQCRNYSESLRQRDRHVAELFPLDRYLVALYCWASGTLTPSEGVKSRCGAVAPYRLRKASQCRIWVKARARGYGDSRALQRYQSCSGTEFRSLLLGHLCVLLRQNNAAEILAQRSETLRT